MEGEEEENNQHHEQNIPENNPSHGSSSSSDNSSSEEWWSLCLDIKERCCIFWNMSVKSYIFFNVMDIVSRLKDKGIPITVPFCMTKNVLFIYIYIYIYSLIYSISFSIVAIAFSIVVLKCTNKNLIHMNIVIRYICVDFWWIMNFKKPQ